MIRMTEWLIQRFVKNPNDTEDTAVRLAYGTLAGSVGIFCNLLLFTVKLITGILSHSAAVMSDAVNNLSDCFSCIITMAGNHFASRPADEEHPFGHGRVEYVISLVVTAIIFSAAFELIKEGVSRILHPIQLYLTPLMFVLLVLTVFVKFWMSRFNLHIAKRIHHTGLEAASKDSMNDVLATGVTILSLVLSKVLSGIPVDGITGILVACYVFFGGYELAKEIVSKLIGSEADQELREKIEALIRKEPSILGFHDLIIHDYGPGNRLGSVHAELSGSLSLKEAHDIIDRCEKEIASSCKVTMTIHPDPIDADADTLFWKEKLEAILPEHAKGLSLHDLHVQKEGENTVLIFDAAVPYGFPHSNREILDTVNEQVRKIDAKARCRITFDRGYLSEEQE